MSPIYTSLRTCPSGCMWSFPGALALVQRSLSCFVCFNLQNKFKIISGLFISLLQGNKKIKNILHATVSNPLKRKLFNPQTSSSRCTILVFLGFLIAWLVCVNIDRDNTDSCVSRLKPSQGESNYLKVARNRDFEKESPLFISFTVFIIQPLKEDLRPPAARASSSPSRSMKHRCQQLGLGSQAAGFSFPGALTPISLSFHILRVSTLKNCWGYNDLSSEKPDTDSHSP